MKITAREIRQIILEESQKIEKEKRSLDAEMLRETWLDLREQGLSDVEIVDGLLSERSHTFNLNLIKEDDDTGDSVEGYFSRVAAGAGDVLKSKISEVVIDTILGAFQVNPQTTFGQMARVVAINVGENFEYSRWREYFSEGSCPLWTETITEAIGESMVIEPIMSGILVQLGLRGAGGAATQTRTPDIAGPGAGAGGILGGTLIRSIEEAINEALLGPVADAIANRLCEIRIRDVVGNVFGLGSIANRLTGGSRSDDYYSAVSAPV
tara:strand:+ start:2038 stop:2838 length:801 start_codon:yes stop_codon:yes gene_type:complete